MNTLQLDARRTALVLIDVQKGILGFPLAPHSASDLVANATRLAKHCAQVGVIVVLVRVAYSAADCPLRDVDAPMPMPAAGFPPEFSELAPELVSVPGHLVITKRNWGAFYGTELDMQLRRRGITHIVLGGIATNFGVESTAREAWQHNFVVYVAEDATTSVAAELHKFSIENILPRIAHVRSTGQIIDVLRGP